MGEITIRAILEEALKREDLLLLGYSRNPSRLEPVRGFETQFDRQQEKCRLLRELIQSLSAEPVKKAIADWQQDVIDGKETGLFAPGGMDR